MSLARDAKTAIFDTLKNDDGHRWVKVRFCHQTLPGHRQSILFHAHALSDQWGVVIPDAMLSKIGNSLLCAHSGSDSSQYYPLHVRKLVRTSAQGFDALIFRTHLTPCIVSVLLDVKESAIMKRWRWAEEMNPQLIRPALIVDAAVLNEQFRLLALEAKKTIASLPKGYDDNQLELEFQELIRPSLSVSKSIPIIFTQWKQLDATQFGDIQKQVIKKFIAAFKALLKPRKDYYGDLLALLDVRPTSLKNCQDDFNVWFKNVGMGTALYKDAFELFNRDLTLFSITEWDQQLKFNTVLLETEKRIFPALYPVTPVTPVTSVTSVTPVTRDTHLPVSVTLWHHGQCGDAVISGALSYNKPLLCRGA